MSATLWFAIISMALGVVGACFSALASVIAYFVKKGEEQQDRELHRLRDEVEHIATTLVRYETHFGAGEGDLLAIRTDLRDHVKREEEIFWKKIDSIADAQRVSNEAVLQRITSIEARMPNGELRELLEKVSRIGGRMEFIESKAEAALQHVEEHNVESEIWKQRIVALEARRRTK
jgi:hypothetical protein